MVVYLILINAAGLVFMYADKQFARRHLQRFPERLLLLTAILGGSLGVFLGMGLFRHKTRHRLFTLSVPILLCLHIIFLVLTLK